MEDLRIARSALIRFRSLSPSLQDTATVIEELKRLKRHPEVGEPVLFDQWKGCLLTYCLPWTIIYKRGNPHGIFVVHFDRAPR